MEDKIVVGIDEAGRGAVIGPLVIAGVSIEESKVHLLEKMGAKDSKELSQKKRVELAKKIEEIAKDVLVIKLGACKIDNYQAQGINLNKMEAMKFADIINFLNGQVAYIDSPDVNLKKIKAFIEHMVKNGTELVVEHKADSTYKIVSAASIIAKVEREKEVADIKKEFGDIGPGYPSNEITMNWLREWRKTHKEFPYIVRKSWDTIKQLEGSRIQGKLSNFFGLKKNEECKEIAE